jgi:peptide/nickel transport system substrate-binding protein
MKTMFKAAGIFLVSLSVALMAISIVYAETPKRGGDVVLVPWYFPTHFNHAITSGTPMMEAGSQIFASLVDINEKWEPIPYLAKSWEISDVLTYTFHLVKGATFHDGRPITSEDVAFSFEIVKKNHTFGPSMLATVDRVETPDAHTAVFKLSKPHPALFLVLSPPFMPIIPKHVYNEEEHGPIRKNPANTNPIGSGPFKFVESKQGEHYILERYDKFFRPGRPYLDRIIVRVILDPSAKLMAFKRGDVNITYWGGGHLPYTHIDMLEKVDHLVVSSQGYDAIGAQGHIEFNFLKPKLKDVRVRRAIAHAIDKDFLVKLLSLGRSRKLTGPISSTMPWYTDKVTKYPLNLEKANRLLDEAGFPRKEKGMRFPLTYDFYPSTSTKTSAEYLKAQLPKIGIDIRLRAAPDYGTWIRRVTSWEHDLSNAGGFSYGDPMIGVHRFYRCDNHIHVVWANTGGYCNPKVDKIMEMATTETDFTKRKALYDEFQQILTEDLPRIFLSEGGFSTIYHKDLKNSIWGVWGSYFPFDKMYWKDGKAPK